VGLRHIVDGSRYDGLPLDAAIDRIKTLVAGWSRPAPEPAKDR
jgi:hypothetical protein